MKLLYKSRWRFYIGC